jgi:hypothetical protein
MAWPRITRGRQQVAKSNIDLVVGREKNKRKIRIEVENGVARAMKQELKHLTTLNRQIWRKATEDR